VAGDPIEKVKAANPFGRISKVLDTAAAGAPPPTTPLAPPAVTKPVGRTGRGDIDLPKSGSPLAQADWADPETGKRMSGTARERDRAMAIKAATNARPMSKRR